MQGQGVAILSDDSDQEPQVVPEEFRLSRVTVMPENLADFSEPDSYSKPFESKDGAFAWGEIISDDKPVDKEMTKVRGRGL